MQGLTISAPGFTKLSGSRDRASTVKVADLGRSFFTIEFSTGHNSSTIRRLIAFRRRELVHSISRSQHRRNWRRTRKIVGENGVQRIDGGRIAARIQYRRRRIVH